MRVQKTAIVGGVPAPLAREIVRKFSGSRPADGVDFGLDGTEFDEDAVLAALIV